MVVQKTQPGKLIRKGQAGRAEADAGEGQVGRGQHFPQRARCGGSTGYSQSS